MLIDTDVHNEFGDLTEYLPRLRELGVPLWISVGGFCAEDYAETCVRLRPGGDAP